MAEILKNHLHKPCIVHVFITKLYVAEPVAVEGMYVLKKEDDDELLFSGVHKKNKREKKRNNSMSVSVHLYDNLKFIDCARTKCPFTPHFLNVVRDKFV